MFHTHWFHALLFWSSYLVFPFIGLMIWLWIKKGFRKTSLFFLIISLFFIQMRWIETHKLEVWNSIRPVYFSSEKSISSLDDIKVAVFSDTHIGVYTSTSFLKKVVDKVNLSNVDFALIPGDLLYYPSDDLEKELKPLSELKMPVIAVLGNHDIGKPGEDYTDILKVALNDLGILILENEIYSLNISDNEINIIGLADLWGERVDFSLLEGWEDKENVIVLTHNPDSAYFFPKNSNIDWVVAGHTHGGQIRIPFIYKDVIPTEHPFDFGVHEVNGFEVFVTPGIGTVGFPLRFRMAPRIDVLRLVL